MKKRTTSDALTTAIDCPARIRTTGELGTNDKPTVRIVKAIRMTRTAI